MLSSPVWANPVLVQQQTCGSGTTSMPCPSITTTVGNTIVVLLSESSTSFIPTISDNRATHLTWNPCPVSGTPIHSPSNNVSAIGWYATDPTGGAIAVTTTLGGPDVQSGNISEWSGVASSSALDNCGAGSADANATTMSFASGSATVSQPNDVVVGITATNCCSGTGDTISAGPTNSFTPMTNSAQSGGTLFPAYLVTSSSPASTAWTALTAGYYAGVAFSLRAAAVPNGFNATFGSNGQGTWAGAIAAFKAPATTGIGTCQSAVGTTALTVSLTGIANGQAIGVFHKGISTDPVITDTLGDTFTTATVGSATVNSASGGCLNFDYVTAPKCTSFPCSDTLTIPTASASANNSAVVCELNSFAGVDALGASGFTAGAIALSGPITPPSSSDLLLTTYYLETSNSFVGPSTNYIGTGTPADIGAATLSDGSRLVGAATEAGVTNLQVGLERSSQPPATAVSAPVGAAGAVHPTSAVKLKIVVFPGA